MRLARLITAVLCALTLAAAGAGSALGQPAGASLPVIERQVMCVTCKIPLNVAESPQADREREFIRSLIAQGKDEAQIKDALVVQYTSAVLGLPETHGFDLAAYLVPVAVVLGLLALFFLLLPSWRRRSAAGPADGAGPMSPEDAARLESDLALFD